jgi:hypothetical protein
MAETELNQPIIPTPQQLPAEIVRLAGELPERKITRLERAIGPEFYRIYKGIFKNPLSIAGLVLIALFILVAAATPLIAPRPLNARGNLFMISQIPRDGFSGVPKPPGTLWESTVPPQAMDEIIRHHEMGASFWNGFRPVGHFLRRHLGHAHGYLCRCAGSGFLCGYWYSHRIHFVLLRRLGG